LGLNSDPTRQENEFEIRFFEVTNIALIGFDLRIFNFYLKKRRKKLLYELNSTGKYFAFKEQLKNSVIKIVREKFFKTSALNDPEEFQVKT